MQSSTRSSPKALSTPRRHVVVRVLFMPVVILSAVVMFLTLPFYLLILVLAPGKGVGGKGSVTMYGVAQQRLLGYRIGLCDDYLAHLVVPAYYRCYEWMQLFTWQIYRNISDRAYGAARCNFVDEAVQPALRDGVTQMVNLGAGVDTRLHRMDFPADIRLFEVDAPASQNIKLKMLAEEDRRKNVIFVACNFEKENWLDALRAAGFDLHQKTLFIWEGVTMYLSEGALGHTLALMGQCARGSIVALDYFEAPGQLRMKLALKTLAWIGEPIKSTPTQDEFTLMVKHAGMNVVEDLNAADILQRYLKHEDGFSIGRCFPIAHFVIAKVN